MTTGEPKPTPLVQLGDLEPTIAEALRLRGIGSCEQARDVVREWLTCGWARNHSRSSLRSTASIPPISTPPTKRKSTPNMTRNPRRRSPSWMCPSPGQSHARMAAVGVNCPGDLVEVDIVRARRSGKIR